MSNHKTQVLILRIDLSQHIFKTYLQHEFSISKYLCLHCLFLDMTIFYMKDHFQHHENLCNFIEIISNSDLKLQKQMLIRLCRKFEINVSLSYSFVHILVKQSKFLEDYIDQCS